MDLPSEKIAIEKDGRCYMCTLKLSTVRGGHHVLYVSDDGLIVKKEPLHRYKERIKRRNNASSRHNVIYQDEINESKPVYNKKPSKNSFRLFHGNPNPDFVPIYGAGRDYHDYGNAFYCTEDYSGAAEWACLRKNISISYVYEYQLQIPSEILSEIRILDFDSLDSIYWLSALLQHRVNNDEGYISELRDRSIALTDLYPTNCENYDIIYGWRADDRHFAIIRDFLSTLISLETAKDAIMLGSLGKQTVIKSERAYTWIRYPDKPEKTTNIRDNEYLLWHNSFIEKDADGRSEYDNIVNKARRQAREQKKRGTTILDILGW